MKAKTHLSQNKSRGGFTLVEMLVVISMIAALAGISFPVYRSIQKKVERQQTEIRMSSLERAVDNFETEYNYLPYKGTVYPATDTPALVQAATPGTGEITNLITVLAGGYTAANPANFKAIRFFEAGEPKGGAGNYKDGLLISGSGATAIAILYDSWGTEYSQMRLDYDLDGAIENPYNTALAVTGKKIIIYDPGENNKWFWYEPGDDDDARNGWDTGR